MTPAETTRIDRLARELFLDSCDALPAGDRAALRAARREALAGRRRLPNLARFLPAGAMMAFLLAVVGGWGYLWQYPGNQADPAATTQVATSQAEADSDLYENLEFYVWLASATDPVSGGLAEIH